MVSLRICKVVANLGSMGTIQNDFWPRIWFYKGTFAPFEALFCSENGDQLAFERGMTQYV